MRLWYHPESDSLFWDEEWPDNGQCDDVTHNPACRAAALVKHGKEPPNAPPVEAADVVLNVEVTSNTTSGGVAGAIIASYKNWERKPADLYPTPVDATEALIPMLKAMKRPDGKPIKRIWEPACGDGRLARVLEWHGFEVISTDLREYPGYGIGGLDFLNEDPLKKWGWDLGEIDAVITNPPFSLAEEFIRHARKITPNVIMLLKQTYWNVKGRGEGLWVDETPSIELKMTWRLAFLKKERGNSPLMDCMWCVWLGDHIAEDKSGQGYCVTEPLHKKEYPGYGGIGLKPAMQVLEGELDELAKLLRGLNG